MAPNDDNDTRGWTLLVEFEVRGGGAAAGQAAGELEAAVQPLRLQPAFMDRVKWALVATVIGHQAAQDETEGFPLTRVRIWKSDPLPRTMTRAEFDSDGNTAPRDRSWGFFVVEKQPKQAAVAAGDRVFSVDLHLYQELA